MTLVQLLLELLYKAFVENDGTYLLIECSFWSLDCFFTFNQLCLEEHVLLIATSEFQIPRHDIG